MHHTNDHQLNPNPTTDASVLHAICGVKGLLRELPCLSNSLTHNIEHCFVTSASVTVLTNQSISYNILTEYFYRFVHRLAVTGSFPTEAHHLFAVRCTDAQIIIQEATPVLRRSGCATPHFRMPTTSCHTCK